MPFRLVLIALRTDLFWGVILTRRSSVTFASPWLCPKFPVEMRRWIRLARYALSAPRLMIFVLNNEVEVERQKAVSSEST